MPIHFPPPVRQHVHVKHMYAGASCERTSETSIPHSEGELHSMESLVQRRSGAGAARVEKKRDGKAIGETTSKKGGVSSRNVFASPKKWEKRPGHPRVLFFYPIAVSLPPQSY